MKNIFQKVGEVEEKSKALIIGAENFVQSFFQKTLLLYGCQTFFSEKFPAVAEIKNFDYIFCFNGEWEQIKKFLEFSEKETKILLALKPSQEKNSLGAKIFELAKEKNLNLRIVYYDDFYGPGMDENHYQSLINFLKETSFQPVFISDFIYGLLKAMFGVGTGEKTFFLRGESKTLGWQPKIKLAEGLQQTEEWFEKNSSDIQKNRVIKIAKKITTPKNLNLFWKGTIIFLILVLTFPLTSLAFWGFFGGQSLKQAQTAILKGDLAVASRKAALAKNFFQSGNDQINQLVEVFGFLGKEKIYKVSNLFNLGKTTAEGMTSFFNSADKAKILLDSVFQKQSLDNANLINGMKLDLEKSFNQLSLAESQLDHNDENVAKIASVRNLIVQARKGVDLLPEILGLGGKQTFLVLFQNNSELRPTGGFIGSFGLLTFENGQLLDFEVQDVYSADGQLKGHVEPPADLKKYLGEAGWYLRDSNWDPDFPSSAAKAGWFLEKETGRVIDGVISIDLVLVQKILETVGEIQVPDYQEKINASNFFERAEYYSEINFFPGSTQKQDFLGSVGRVLFDKIKQGDEKIWFNLVKNIYPSLKSKDLLLWLKDEQAEQILRDLDWGGELKTRKCPAEIKDCLEDYLMVVEANVGVNKANYFLKRSFSHQVQIDENGGVRETLHLDYQNNSASEAFPAGRYKSYVRIYTPLQTELLGMTIKNPLTGETKEATEKEIQEDHGKQIFGFLIEVPIQENRSVEIIYHLADKIAIKDGQYQILVQKQPGIEDQAFNFLLTPPNGITALSKNLKSNQTSEGIFFTPVFNQDLMFEINLVK